MATCFSFMLPTTRNVRGACGMRPRNLPVSHSMTSRMVPGGNTPAGRSTSSAYSSCESAV